MRLFISVSLTPEVKKCVRAHADWLKHSARRGRYPGDENYHITLAFIGEYSDLRRVKSAMDRVRFSPIEVTAGGLGNFGSLYYVRVFSENRALDRLAESVKSALDGEGIPYDGKRFRGHITVAREAEMPDVAVNMPRLCAGMKVSAFSLMKSEQIGGKRVYTELYSVSAE